MKCTFISHSSRKCWFQTSQYKELVSCKAIYSFFFSHCFLLLYPLQGTIPSFHPSVAELSPFATLCLCKQDNRNDSSWILWNYSINCTVKKYICKSIKLHESPFTTDNFQIHVLHCENRETLLNLWESKCLGFCSKCRCV